MRRARYVVLGLRGPNASSPARRHSESIHGPSGGGICCRLPLVIAAMAMLCCRMCCSVASAILLSMYTKRRCCCCCFHTGRHDARSSSSFILTPPLFPPLFLPPSSHALLPSPPCPPCLYCCSSLSPSRSSTQIYSLSSNHPSSPLLLLSLLYCAPPSIRCRRRSRSIVLCSTLALAAASLAPLCSSVAAPQFYPELQRCLRNH
jgi:hypothetical protein